MASNVQHLSYAGITLPLSPSFLEDTWLKVVHDRYDNDLGSFWNFDRPNQQTLPTPSLPVPPKFSLDVLSWPTGASNVAWFHTIVETNRWNNIRAICAPDNYNTPQSLVFFDGRAGKTITAPMYICGAARPLNQLGNIYNDLWLITLVDQRFYWYYSKGSITQPSSWSNLYSQIGTILGVSITPDSISSNYGVPSSKWVLPYQVSTPAILDAVANQIGQRIVVSLSGQVTTVNWTTARSAAQNYINNINGTVISGGLIEESAIANSVPSSVQTLFLNASTNPPASTPYVINVTLESLNIPEYSNAVGLPNYLQTIYADTQYNGSNLTAITNYATQAASDWYGWRLVDIDLVYPGIEPWVPTGWEDEIRWTLKLVEQNPALPDSPYDDPYSKTQIHRGPWIDFQVGNYYAGYTPSSGGTTNNLYQNYQLTPNDDPDDYFPIPGPIGPTGTKGNTGSTGPAGLTIPPNDPDLEDYFPIPGPIGPTGTTGGGNISYPIVPFQGGTGIANNNISTLTIQGNNGTNYPLQFTLSGNTAVQLTGNLSTVPTGNTTGFPAQFQLQGATNVILPQTGTIPNTDVSALPQLQTINTITTGTWNGSVVQPTYGGTGVNNGNNTITVGGNLVTNGGNITLTATGSTNVTLPTSGVLVNNLVTTLANLGAIGVQTQPLNMGGYVIDNLANPVNSTDVVNLQTLQTYTQGITAKYAASCATTGALPTYTYTSGVITFSLTGVETIDGVATTVGSFVLVKNETSTNAPYNGLYQVTTAGAVGVAGIWTRANDMNTGSQFPGAQVFIEQGTTNGTTGWVCSNTSPPTVGTTPITFVQNYGAGTYTADGTTIALSGNQFSIASGYTGQSSITTLGTVTSGTWHGAAIANSYLVNSAITIGSSGVSLGNTITSIAGLTLTSPTFTSPTLGTPASGNLANCTFPTLNQNTTGQAGTVATISGLITAGTNIIVTGSGTNASPYVVATTIVVPVVFDVMYSTYGGAP
jgi:hypothetical protein